jgi:two-component system NtrC family sensor kinase
MLLLGFFLPFIPMLLVSGYIAFQYHRAHAAVVLSSNEAHAPTHEAPLGRAAWHAIGAIVVAGSLLAVNSISLSTKTVKRIRLADRKKERMAEQMFQTSKLAAIGELAAGIAHEINNPVAIMVEEAGWISDLLEDVKNGKELDVPEIERAARQIQAQGTRCKKITYKLLSFARVTDFSPEEVDLKELVNDVVQMSAKRAEYDGVSISVDAQEDLPLVRLPRTETQQVLINLVNNALDAMEGSHGNRIKIAVTADGHVLRITVADNGPGIAQENQKKIFDPFFTTKPVGKGTGLGLSICYGIVKKIGGEISVRSRPGEGSEFSILLPLKEAYADSPPFDLATSDSTDPIKKSST